MEQDTSLAAPSGGRRWLRWTLIACAAALVVGVIVYQSMSFIAHPPQRRRRFQQGGDQPVGVQRIGRGDIRLSLQALGAVTPLATVTVTTQINGLLMSVAFKEGQLVRKGQLLAQIDPRPYEVALEQDQAQLARDQASLEQARMDLKRYATLSGQQSIARQTYEDQVWTVKQDQGTVDYDKAQIKAQQLNLTYCRIVAPTDGRVGLRQVDPGNYVQTGSTSGIVVLTALKPTTVEFAVPEDSLPQIMQRVHSGAALPVTAFDRANVTELATGQLAAVDTQVNSTTGTVMLRANFENADERLYPSQFVNVVLLLDTLKDVVRVPVGAVQRGAPGSYVYLVDSNDTVSVHTVALGAQDGDFYAVESGLSPGDVVVTDGADRLRDGAKVSIPDKSAPAAPKEGRRHWQGDGTHAGGHGNGTHHHRPPGDRSAPNPPPHDAAPRSAPGPAP
ncbi:MAG TPA: efflux RND transporter periplasmic adaptor subunit [Steroidobacteraceae bacterium]|nr:efflux RND transporter periplasmic adaptor subunit [Steroidobacteraceae bacterium]